MVLVRTSSKGLTALDLTTVLGLIVGMSCVVLAYVIDGGKVASLLIATSAMLVFGGTIGATIISFHSDEVKKMPRLIAKAFKKADFNLSALTKQIVDYAEKARREGLLSLEKDVAEIKDPFLKRAMTVITGTMDTNLAREMLEMDIHTQEQHRKREAKMFDAAGGYAPTMGIIGTVMGLVHILGNLSSPEKLAEAISGAFIATFYGVFSANIFWLPIAEKLKLIIEKEKDRKILIVEGVLSIMQGENPRVIEEKLQSFAPAADHES